MTRGQLLGDLPLVTLQLPKGVLVVIEGIDGAGKTTQTEDLCAHLRSVGLEVVRSKEPTNGPWGQQLRASSFSGRLPPDQELDLFLKDRQEHVARVIGPALERGAVVVVDRYYYSTAAYQGARGMDPEEILRRNAEIAPVPDLAIFLEVAASVGVSRIAERGDGSGNLFEREEDLQTAARIFAALQGPEIQRIDGALPAAEISYRIREALLTGPLFRSLCLKTGLAECEPSWCTFRLSGACHFAQLGPLAPVESDGSPLLAR